MSVKLRKRKNTDGTTTLMLDIYHNGKRSYEFLKQLKLAKPSNAIDRENNKERIRQAEAIAVARAAELQANDYNMVTNVGKKTIVTEWMQSYVDNYTKKDKRNVQGALNRFKDFLNEKRKPKLTFGGLTPLIIEAFIDYLESKSTGEGAVSYYKRFKKMIRHAYRQKLMKENVLDFVQSNAHGKAKRRDILTIDELKALASTPTESSEVRRAFLFSCMSGLRWVDVKSLTWVMVNLKDRRLNIRQEKTKEDVSIPLNETAVKLLEEPGKPNELVFTLPTANGANKTLKAWVKRAGIDKYITFHCGRHSFGTNLIFNDVDVLTASKLLGHVNLKYTQRYVRAAEEMKQKATDTLNLEI